MEEFFMQKNTNMDEEMIFFDAEIVEDDGEEDIPVGTLVSAPVAADVAIKEAVEDSPSETNDETPAQEAVPAPAIAEAPEQKAEPKPAPAKPKTTTAPKKTVNESDIWGVAVINTKKPKQEKPAEEAKPEPKKEVKKPAPKKTKAEAPKEASDPAPAKAEAPAPKAETKPATTQKNTSKKTSEEEPKVAKETKAPEEQIIQEGTREYHGKFVIKKTDKGHFVYKLFAYGNKCVAIGAQAYESLSGVKGGIASVAKNAGIETIIDLTKPNDGKLPCPRWEIFEDKKEEFRLRLIATNGNLVATTNDGYTTKAAAKKGIESVAKAADGASIVRNDNAW